MVTSQRPVPVQAPDQPVNPESGRGPAVRWTSGKGSSYVYTQSAGEAATLSHSAPGGLTLTVPRPPAVALMVRDRLCVGSTVTMTLSVFTPPNPSRTMTTYSVVWPGVTVNCGPKP